MRILSFVLLFLGLVAHDEARAEYQYTRLSASPDGSHVVLWDRHLDGAASNLGRSDKISIVDLETQRRKSISLRRPVHLLQWHSDGGSFLAKAGVFFGEFSKELELLEEGRARLPQLHILWVPLSYLSDQTLDDFLDLKRRSIPYGRSPIASRLSRLLSNVGEEVRFGTKKKALEAYSASNKFDLMPRAFWYHAGALGEPEAGDRCTSLLDYQYLPVIDYSQGTIVGCFSHVRAYLSGQEDSDEGGLKSEEIAFEGRLILDAMSNGSASFFLLHEPSGRQSIVVKTAEGTQEIDLGATEQSEQSTAHSAYGVSYIEAQDSKRPLGLLVSQPQNKRLVVRFHGGPRAHPLNSVTHVETRELYSSGVDILEVFGVGALGTGQESFSALKRNQVAYRERLLNELKGWVESKNYTDLSIYGASFGGAIRETSPSS